MCWYISCTTEGRYHFVNFQYKICKEKNNIYSFLSLLDSELFTGQKRCRCIGYGAGAFWRSFTANDLSAFSCTEEKHSLSFLTRIKTNENKKNFWLRSDMTLRSDRMFYLPRTTWRGIFYSEWNWCISSDSSKPIRCRQNTRSWYRCLFSFHTFEYR